MARLAAPLLPPDLLALAEWLAANYHHPIGETLAATLPVAAASAAGDPLRAEDASA